MTRFTSLKGESKINVKRESEHKGQKTKKGATERKGRRMQGNCKHRWGRLGKLFKLIPIQGSHLYTGTIRRASVKISGDGSCLKSTWNRTLLGKGLVVQEAAPMALADSCHSELSGRA